MAVTFDSAGTTGHGLANSTSSITFTVTPSGAAYVVVYVMGDPTGVTCGGAAMTQIGTRNQGGFSNTGSVYGLAVSSGGAKTIVVSFPSTSQGEAYGESWLGVDSVGAAQLASANGGSLSHACTIGGAGSVLIQMFGTAGPFPNNQVGSLSGGTNRYNTPTASYETITVNSATANTTFSGTNSGSSSIWVSIGIVLNPVAGTTVQPGGASVAATTGTPVVTATGPVTVTPPGAVVSIAGGTPGGGAFGQTPMTKLISDLNAGQSVTLQFLGDSTVWGYGSIVGSTDGGWVKALGILIGQLYNVTVQMRQFVYAPPYSYYGNPLTLFVGAGTNTITLLNGGISGITLSGIQSALGSLLTVANPDAIFIGDGINDAQQGATGTSFVSAYQTLISGVQSYCPGVPIITITENPVNNYATQLQALFDAWATFMVGQNTPITPGLRDSTGAYPTGAVWVLDTKQAFNNVYQASMMLDNYHPNATGYQTQAQWMFNQLMAGVIVKPSVTVTPGGASSALTPGTPTVTAAGSIVPTGGNLAITPGTPTVTTTGNQFIVPAGAAVVLAPGTPAVTSTANRVVTPGRALDASTGGVPLVIVAATGATTENPTGGVITTTGAAPLITIGQPFSQTAAILWTLSGRSARLRELKSQVHVE